MGKPESPQNSTEWGRHRTLYFWTSGFLPPPEILLFRDIFVLILILFMAAFPLAGKKKQKQKRGGELAIRSSSTGQFPALFGLQSEVM